MSSFDILPWLTYASLALGFMVALERWYIRPRKLLNDRQLKIYHEIAGYFWPLVIVWFLRAFVIQLYRVPTGSLEPTVHPGDVLLVAQYPYGIKVPVLNATLWAGHNPQAGEIALFRWPVDPHVYFVKRVIGVPGDHVSYHQKQLTINGQLMNVDYVGPDHTHPLSGAANLVTREDETITSHDREIHHAIYIHPFTHTLLEDIDITVPTGYYFMMGDNRDESSDSRMWGLVPREAFVGRPIVILLNVQLHGIRLSLSRWWHELT